MVCFFFGRPAPGFRGRSEGAIGAPAIRDTAGRARSAKFTACIYISAWSNSRTAGRTVGLTVVSCVASRNKRRVPAGAIGGSYPNWFDFGGRSQRGPKRASRVAALRRGWLRPARPKGSHIQRPFVRALFAVAASGECNELRRVAVRRMGWRQTARFFEPQLQHPILQDSSPAHSSPQFSAPCQPHCGSAVAPPRFRAPCAIHLYSAHTEIVESLLLA